MNMSFFQIKNEVKEVKFGELTYKVKRPPLKIVQPILEAYNRKEIGDVEYNKKLLFVIFREMNPEVTMNDIEELPWNFELMEESQAIFLALGYTKKKEKSKDTPKTTSQTQI